MLGIREDVEAAMTIAGCHFRHINTPFPGMGQHELQVAGFSSVVIETRAVRLWLRFRCEEGLRPSLAQ
jgi:hypothetical protein